MQTQSTGASPVSGTTPSPIEHQLWCSPSCRPDRVLGEDRCTLYSALNCCSLRKEYIILCGHMQEARHRPNYWLIIRLNINKYINKQMTTKWFILKKSKSLCKSLCNIADCVCCPGCLPASHQWLLGHKPAPNMLLKRTKWRLAADGWMFLQLCCCWFQQHGKPTC